MENSPIQLPIIPPEDRENRYVSKKFLLENPRVAEEVDEFLNGFYVAGVYTALYNWRVIGYVPGVAGELLITVHVYDGRGKK